MSRSKEIARGLCIVDILVPQISSLIRENNIISEEEHFAEFFELRNGFPMNDTQYRVANSFFMTAASQQVFSSLPRQQGISTLLQTLAVYFAAKGNDVMMIHSNKHECSQASATTRKLKLNTNMMHIASLSSQIRGHTLDYIFCDTRSDSIDIISEYCWPALQHVGKLVIIK